jgi:hypothetical protein
VAVASALIVVGVWFARRPAPRAESVTEATLAIQVTRHDAFGAPSKPIPIRDRAKVRAILESISVDALRAATCPADYATADVGLLLTGRDVYARRNAYLWDTKSAAPRVVLVDETGCRAGLVPDAERLRASLGI